MNACYQIVPGLLDQPAFLIALGMSITLLALSVRRTPDDADEMVDVVV